jgi:phosphoribosylformylglycinamidine synthase
VTDSGRLRIFERGVLVGDVPTRALTDEAPMYRRPSSEPAWQREAQALDLRHLSPPSPQVAFERLLASPIVASKRWAYQQYDHTVGTNTIAQPGTTAGMTRVKGTTLALAVSVDGNGRFCHLDPYRGAMLVVAESARNVACAGGEPIGATNNLNFGNPERPEIMWQLAEAIRGIGDACRALEIPITGGNVSLYNETDGEAIYPTPVLGVVGVLEDASKTVTRRFQSDGARVILLGDNRGELGGSEYLAVLHDTVAGRPPALDLARERSLQQLVIQAIRHGLVESAHDCAEGGLAVAIAECCFDTPFGVRVDIPRVADAPHALAVNATLFGESASRIVVSVAEAGLTRLTAAAAAAGVPATVIGTVGGDRIQFAVDGRATIDLPRDEADAIWSTAIERTMAKRS